MEQLIATYGYWAILIGTFFEGETILVMGGYAAHRGWLGILPVMLVAVAGSFSGDQLYFTVGRRRGLDFLDKRPHWHRRVSRGTELLRRHQNLAILSTRFLYGLRIVLPFAIGASGVSPLRFAVLNCVSAVPWAVLFGLGGYYIGEAMEALLGDLRRHELQGMAGIVAVGVAIWLVRLLRRVRRRRKEAPGPPQ